ncbi:MAG TPA: thioredoxin domain-containing protein [Polyangiaceae bacterium]|nr:thioredoxin domain-containing protein [Polyangiaceae bacterium]
MLSSRCSRFTSLIGLAWFVAACAVNSHAGNAPPAVAVPAAQNTAVVQLATATPNQAQQPTSDPLPIGSDDAVWGSPSAPVTIVEFSDLQCPFCARVHPTLQALEAKYGPGKLRIVFKNNPLPFHQNAMPAAKVADAVLRQGGSRAFFGFLDLAFSEQTKLGDAALSDWVRRVGLDPAIVVPRAGLQDSADKIQRDMALAAKVGANGTPGFRINGKALNGAQPIEEFTRIIDAELIAAADLTQKGTPADAVYKARVAANFTAPTPSPDQDDEPADDLTIWKIPVAGAPSIGPKDALVTIVEFYDYQCPYCRRVQATLNEVLARYPKDVRLVLRQNPLPFHPRALPAANLALEARAEKGDAGFIDATHGLFDDKRGLEDADLEKLGNDLKLDPKRVHNAIAQNTHASEIDADIDLANDFKASGTPYFFINGQRLSGAQPIESFVTAIDAQLKVANALVADGTQRARMYDEILKRAKDADPPEQKSIPAPSAENPSRGPVNAPVVIHEFADFQCPFCSRVEPTLQELDKAFPGKLRFVWHDLPLPFHPHARPAALVAREARAEKGDAAFWKIHDFMFRDQSDEHAFSGEKFAEYASALGLDAGKLQAAPSDGRHDAALAHDQSVATAAKINGTPAFVINGYFVSGAQPLSAFKRAVRYALAHPPKKPSNAGSAAR